MVMSANMDVMEKTRKIVGGVKEKINMMASIGSHSSIILEMPVRVASTYFDILVVFVFVRTD